MNKFVLVKITNYSFKLVFNRFLYLQFVSFKYFYPLQSYARFSA